MNGKIIVAIAIVAVVAIAGGAAAVIMMNGKDDFKATDADQIASSLSKNYSGFFGTDFYLADGATSGEAKVSYPNGSSRGSSENYVKIYVFDDKSKAKDEFETNKTDYEKQIGSTVMGSKIQGISEKSSFSDSIGYYNNFNMGTASSYMYYTGYYSNVFFEVYISLSGKQITDDSVIKDFADAIYKAIKEPVPVEEAKKS